MHWISAFIGKIVAVIAILFTGSIAVAPVTQNAPVASSTAIVASTSVQVVKKPVVQKITPQVPLPVGGEVSLPIVTESTTTSTNPNSSFMEVHGGSSGTPVKETFIPQQSAQPAPMPAISDYVLEVVRADQEDTGRWNNEKGHGCFRTTFHVAVMEGSRALLNAPVTLVGQETQLTQWVPAYSNNLARFVFQPSTSTPQTLVFTHPSGAQVTYQCQ